MAEPLLRLDGVTAGYGDAVVLHGVSLEIPENGSLAVLGRNGVGKSTLLLTIMGYTQMRAGTVTWRGQDMSRLAPNKRALAGIGWVAQEREIFPSLTVEENLTVAARAGDWTLAAIYKMFPRLDERRRNKGNQLSGGEQQMLAIARALMRDPKILLLDEPFEGLAPIIVRDLMKVCRDLAAAGQTIVLVEQNLAATLALAQRVYIINNGHIVHEGPALEIKKQPEVLQRYLGV